MGQLTFCAAALGFALAIGPATASDCKIDAAKAISWAQFGGVKSKFTPPVAAIYNGCGKTLTYVAAEHSNDPNGKTFATVRSAHARSKPKALILEGFPTQMGENPDRLIQHAKKVAGTPADAEPYLAIRLTQEAGGRFMGGEPEDSEILAIVMRQGLNVRDLFGLYVLRQIEQWKRVRQLSGHNDAKLDALIAQYAQIFSADAKIPISDIAAVSTLAGFRKWYSQTNGLEFETHYRPEDAWPPSPKSDRKTNAQIAIVSDARERHILAVVGQAIQTYANVMVVYGFSHHDIQAPALEAAFGPAAIAE